MKLAVKYDPLKAELEGEGQQEQEQDKVRVSVSIARKEHDRLMRIAEKLQVSVSDVIRIQISHPRFLETIENML